MKNSENRLFMDVHVIQNVPPSNINRDDTGSPKTAQYGGVRRARVSSQAWKSAMRGYFYANSQQSNVGVRSLDIVNYVKDFILEMDTSIGEEDALKKANKVINDAGIKTSKANRVKALFFLGHSQAKELAKAALEGVTDKKVLKNIIKSNPAIDIALFGRMVAGDPSLNEDASSQVAHAISTHAVQTEFDFFIAVDDLAPEDNAGAGMLGTVEYHASTLYRYANVAVHELLKQLGDQQSVIDTVKLFVEAFSNSMPTGKINTFGNQTLPQAVFVTLRTDRPVSLVSAFEQPVTSSEGYVKKSIERLMTEHKNIQKIVNHPEVALYVGREDGIEAIDGEIKGCFDELLTTLASSLELALPNLAKE